MHCKSKNSTILEQPPLLSVIVPVYNVVDYLEQCLGSIVSQTYKNMEILIIDDGSSDGSGQICDCFAEQDNRVHVFHTDNNGLSSARNYGLEKSHGEWISFIDSDDWLDNHMFSSLMNSVVIHNAEIGICGYYSTEKKKEKKYDCSDNEKVLIGNEIFQVFICNNRISNAVWNKIYKRDLFVTANTFPVGRNYEDSIVLTRLLLRSRCIVLVQDSLYHYRRRKNSIVSTHTLKNESDRWISYKEVYEELSEKIPEYHKELLIRTVNGAKGIWKYYYGASKDEKMKYYYRLKDVSDFVTKHYKDIRNAGTTFKMKVWMWMFVHPSRAVFAILYYYTSIRTIIREKDYY